MNEQKKKSKKNRKKIKNKKHRKKSKNKRKRKYNEMSVNGNKNEIEIMSDVQLKKRRKTVKKHKKQKQNKKKNKKQKKRKRKRRRKIIGNNDGDNLLELIAENVPITDSSELNLDSDDNISMDILEDEKNDSMTELSIVSIAENILDEKNEEWNDFKTDEKLKITFRMCGPKSDKLLPVKVLCNDSFADIKALLEKKYKMKVVLSFDGDIIQDMWTMNTLVQDFDFENDDMIDARWTKYDE